jgi:hypothetical protein
MYNIIARIVRLVEYSMYSRLKPSLSDPEDEGLYNFDDGEE